MTGINELIHLIGDYFPPSVTKKMVRSLLFAFGRVMWASLLKEESIRLPGCSGNTPLGRLVVKRRDGRQMRNPRTGDKVYVPPTLVVKFVPSDAFKEELQKWATKNN